MSQTREMRLLSVGKRLEAAFLKIGNEEAVAVARLTGLRLQYPQVFVTVSGETSTGKSTLINGLLGSPILPMYARPTTATVTQVICVDQTPPRYSAVYRDATQEELEHETFSAYSMAPPDDLLRLQVCARPVDPQMFGLQVFDTPGFNAILAGHEEVLRRFLPESDLIVFTVGYRSGFGQVDQELLEIIRQCTEGDPDIPVVLVVNRTPPGVAHDDKRMQEIINNAVDSLHRKPELVIVPSMPQREKEYSEETGIVLPETRPLWNAVRIHAGSRERLEVVVQKLAGMLFILCEEGREIITRRRLALDASETEKASLRREVDILKKAKADSQDAVARCMKKLEGLLPRTIDTLASDMKKKINNDIRQSNKWLGQEDCRHWIYFHALPFEVRAAGRQIEDLVHQELENLDKELEEISNTVVARIEKEVVVQTDAMGDFKLSLARTLIERAGGAVINRIFRAFGGIGGEAAGAGNLVKMLVKRVGGVIDRQFGREVYENIGKLFTKRMMERLNVAVTVIIEIGLFVRDANKWQDKESNLSSETILKWCKEVKDDIVAIQIPAMRTANEQEVEDIYSGLISEIEAILDKKIENRDAEKNFLDTVGIEFDEIRSDLELTMAC